MVKKSILISLLGLCSCQDVVKVTVPGAEPVLVVDGWITDRPGADTVRISQSQTYFNSTSNTVVSGAQLSLSSFQGSEDLQETAPGIYLIKTIRAKEGVYTLDITTSGATYRAICTVSRLSPVIDSVKFQYEQKSRPLYDTAGFYGFIFGRELAGLGDHVRFKLYVNNRFQNDKETLDIRDDRFVDGTYLDSLAFLQKSPFRLGDKVRLEEWSLSKDAYGFYSDIRTQINNQGLFAKTSVNVRSNVVKTSNLGRPAVGYFGGSLVKTYRFTVF